MKERTIAEVCFKPDPNPDFMVCFSRKDILEIGLIFGGFAGFWMGFIVAGGLSGGLQNVRCNMIKITEEEYDTIKAILISLTRGFPGRGWEKELKMWEDVEKREFQQIVKRKGERNV